MDRHSPLQPAIRHRPSMSLLMKKLNHGNQTVLSWPVIRVIGVEGVAADSAVAGGELVLSIWGSIARHNNSYL